MKVGIAVVCPKCHRTKAPMGRSLPHEVYNSYCNRDECPFYWDAPRAGSLFPGESEQDFGYPVGSDGTREHLEDFGRYLIERT